METHLLVDHVTHGHSDLHACSLNVEEVEVMEHRQANGAQTHPSCVAQSLVQSRHVFWVVILEEHNNLPQEDWLDHFEDFLREREEELVSQQKSKNLLNGGEQHVPQ